MNGFFVGCAILPTPEQNADPFHALRYLDLQQLLDGQDEAQLVHHVVEVAHPVGQRDNLLILEFLAVLLDTHVTQADTRHGAVIVEEILRACKARKDINAQRFRLLRHHGRVNRPSSGEQ